MYKAILGSIDGENNVHYAGETRDFETLKELKEALKEDSSPIGWIIGDRQIPFGQDKRLTSIAQRHRIENGRIIR